MPNGIVICERKLKCRGHRSLPRRARHAPWPAERIEYWAIEELIPYAENALLHREADMYKLVDSLRRWGWTNPVLTPTFRLAGNQPEATLKDWSCHAGPTVRIRFPPAESQLRT
jgi:hypothetical protein